MKEISFLKWLLSEGWLELVEVTEIEDSVILEAVK